MAKITVLRAHDKRRLSKRFTPTEKFDYDNAFWYSHADHDIDGIEEFSLLLTALEGEPYSCIIRAELLPDVDPDQPVLRRKDAYDGHRAYYRERAEGLPWCVIDFDKIPAPDGLLETERIEWLLSLLPAEFHDASFHFQWSSSAGTQGWDTLSCHLWFWLSEARTDQQMSDWAEWTQVVDDAPMRTVQPHYTAAPIFEGVADPLAGGKRSGLVSKAQGSVLVPLIEKPAYEWVSDGSAFSDAPRGFEARLAAIGPRLHLPIQKAIASGVTCGLDGGDIKRRIRERVTTCPKQGQDIEPYLKDRYLDRSIRDAARKFGSRVSMAPSWLDPDAALKAKLARMRQHTGSAALIINGVDAPCGAGKTYWRLSNIAKGGRHLYVVGKISDIAEKRREFQSKFPLAGIGFDYAEAHSEVTGGGTVPGQLIGMRAKLDASQNPNWLVIVTHAALVMHDWSEWDDFAVTIDEKLDVWHSATLPLKLHHEHLRQYLAVEEEDGDSYVLRLTDAGQRLGERALPDDVIAQQYWALLNYATRHNNVVSVERAGWDRPQSEAMNFRILATPELLAAFRERWMMADELSKSLIARMWEARYGVAWQWHTLPTPRQRKVPVGERLTVHYFCDQDDASFARFRELDGPLEQVAKWLAARRLAPFIWTANERFRAEVQKAGGFTGSYLTPKQAGTNEYIGFHCVVWLAAMKVHRSESRRIEAACGMKQSEVERDREHDALFQFAMRSSLRDYDSDAPVDVYLFSKRQADYLIERLGGTSVQVSGVVTERQRKGKGGRPPKPGGAMTSTERSQKRRETAKEVCNENPYRGAEGESFRCTPEKTSQKGEVSIGVIAARVARLAITPGSAQTHSFDRATPAMRDRMARQLALMQKHSVSLAD